MSRLLVVIDMQNDFIGGVCGTREAELIVPNTVNKIQEYVKAGDEVVFTLDTHDESYPNTQEGRKLPVIHCVKGTGGWELHKDIEHFEGRRFEKNTFGSWDLAEYVSKGNYERIELVGVCTDICVISNALLIKAAVPEIPVYVDSHCCAGVTPKSHENALDALRMCQVEVI